MTVSQISVFIENSAGRLAEVTEIIAASGINLWAMSIADRADFGVLRLIADQPDRALEVLKGKGCIVSVTQVITAQLDDRPGSLAKMLRILSDESISVEYLYAFAVYDEDAGKAYVVCKVDDDEKATKVLKEKGVAIANIQTIGRH